MSSNFGDNFTVSLFGTSHGSEIGVIAKGLPENLEVNLEYIAEFCARRSPKNQWSTSRREPDTPIIVSGVENGKTNGEELKVIIKNTDVKSSDYDNIELKPRPSHADYPAFVKYGKNYDFAGGGQFSGRLTAPLCFLGGLIKYNLEKQGIYIGSHIMSVADIKDDAFSIEPTIDELLSPAKKQFPTINDAVGEKMIEKIMWAKEHKNSVGGTVECAVVGLPVGVGSPFFGSVEGRISRALFGIPAVKGVQFGMGFEGTTLLGSRFNDEYYTEGKTVKTATNNNGGILGGLANGMPVTFTVAVKPTPSIGLSQKTVNLKTMENTEIVVNGRHDPCILPRILPCIESACAIAIFDILGDEND